MGVVPSAMKHEMRSNAVVFIWILCSIFEQLFGEFVCSVIKSL